jgi:polyisoprenoid-binding protein YceI
VTTTARSSDVDQSAERPVPGTRTPATAATTRSVSDSRTTLTFTVSNFGRPVHGSLALSWGEVAFDGTGAPVRVRAEMDLSSIDTGIAKRDADLRKPRLLDIDRHPTMTFSAVRFSREDGGGWTADGSLTVRGQSVPLAVTGIPEAGPDGWVRVRATATLDRTTIGLRVPALLIGRTVTIGVDAWIQPCPLPHSSRAYR